ncbi:hypothetical protein [Flavobacterium sp. NRK1]|uniref:glycosyl-4,4'-diaponeurosporenoate acyltransferase CrtO family protein n=1 Tax=Flavobacterium sp. NRK1 TaxID=2954929 RepID=UPI0035B34C8E
MILYNIFTAVFVAFGFSVFGLLINNAIKHKRFYNTLTNFNFVRQEKANRILGIFVLKYIILHSFWGKFNPLLTVKERNRETLIQVRKEMTYAEISHLICFILILLLLPILYISNYRTGLIIPLFICNIIFHLYPPLLQQYNKRRLDKIIVRMKP